MMNNAVEDYLCLPYAVEIETDECGGQLCFVAYNPELPGCMAQGATRRQAAQSLVEARRLYIQSLIDDKQEIPLPQILQPS